MEIFVLKLSYPISKGHVHSENGYNHQLLTKNKRTGGKIRQKSINVPVCLLESLEYFKLYEIKTNI